MAVIVVKNYNNESDTLLPFYNKQLDGIELRFTFYFTGFLKNEYSIEKFLICLYSIVKQVKLMMH